MKKPTIFEQRRLWLAGALMLAASAHCAAAQQTDPRQYEARITQEVAPFLSNCQAYMNTDSPAVCHALQANFGEAYYNALEGNQADKWSVGLMFLEGDGYGVKYNPTMGCAWLIEAADTGGTPHNDAVQQGMVSVCRENADAVAQAAALKAEEDRVASLTY